MIGKSLGELQLKMFSKGIALLQLPCEFGIINQSEALIPYEIFGLVTRTQYLRNVRGVKVAKVVTSW